MPLVSLNSPIDLTTPLAPPQFVLDNAGNQIAAVLPITSHEQLMDAFRELQDIVASECMHDAIARGEEEVIPFDQAMAEVSSASNSTFSGSLKPRW